MAEAHHPLNIPAPDQPSPDLAANVAALAASISRLQNAIATLSRQTSPIVPDPGFEGGFQGTKSDLRRMGWQEDDKLDEHGKRLSKSILRVDHVPPHTSMNDPLPPHMAALIITGPVEGGGGRIAEETIILTSNRIDYFRSIYGTTFPSDDNVPILFPSDASANMVDILLHVIIRLCRGGKHVPDEVDEVLRKASAEPGGAGVKVLDIVTELQIVEFGPQFHFNHTTLRALKLVG
ncbi:TAM domain methyltransferase [Ceratobasidium sp. AG-Ba]|nr:TAM domain methyltransferase [Ceratobasidium sp. AG-Ba]